MSSKRLPESPLIIVEEEDISISFKSSEINDIQPRQNCIVPEKKVIEKLSNKDLHEEIQKDLQSELELSKARLNQDRRDYKRASSARINEQAPIFKQARLHNKRKTSEKNIHFRRLVTIKEQKDEQEDSDLSVSQNSSKEDKSPADQPPKPKTNESFSSYTISADLGDDHLGEAANHKMNDNKYYLPKPVPNFNKFGRENA